MILISLILLILYLIIVSYLNKDIPETISETFFLGGKYMFTFIMWLLGISLLISMLDIVPENQQFLIFFISSGLFLIGASPYFKEGLERKIHLFGFFISTISLLTWMLHLWYIFVIVAIISYFINKYFIHKWAFMLECCIFISGGIAALVYKLGLF